jgi:restriction system protein
MVGPGENVMGIRMGRGRRGLLDDLAVLPWPVGLAVGVLGFGLIRYGIPAWTSGQPGPFAQAFGKTDAFAPLAWAVLAACAMASLFCWLDARRRARLCQWRDRGSPNLAGTRSPLEEPCK